MTDLTAIITDLAASSDAADTDAKISLAILARVAEGATAPEAIDAVLGAGTYERLAGDVYDALRAKAK